MAEGFHELVGLEPNDSAHGWSHVVLHADDRHLNGHGTGHGGAMATLCDTAMGMAVVAAGTESPVTIEMKVTYLRPAEQGELTAQAQVRKTGKRIVVVEAEVTQHDETVALASGTFANATG